MVDDTPAQPVEEQREPGEGSPRGSGDEHESFLRRSQSATDGMREREPSARLINDAAVGVAVAGASGQDNSRSTKGSGEKTDGSSQYATGESAGSHPSPGARHILPRDVLLRMYEDDEPTPGHTLTPHDEEHEPRVDSPLLPPPAINVDPLVVNSSRKHHSTQSLLSEGSVTPGGDPEKATVQTARRVRVGDLPPRLPDRLTTVEDESPRDEASPSGATWLGGSFAKLGRFSFLNRPPPSPGSRSPSRGVSRPSSLVVHGLSDADVEAARASLRPEMGYRDDPRPISTVSGKSAVSSSGGTIYHDASSRPATPGGVGSNSSAARAPSRLAVSHGPEHSVSDADPAPPAYEAQASPSSSYSGGRALASDLRPGFADILDLPAPPPDAPFAASRKSTTAVPPGLTSMPNPRVWRNSGTGSPLSPNSFITAGSNTSGSTTGIMIDVLEEAPPAAGEGWRLMSRGAMDDSQGRRTTFGQVASGLRPPT
ncbi:hypothetical protein EWM64_g5742 [Hericium alpestre]|uniref:Uncharacterized protein n=1 Tax=Hericium alpestre TaxID=135208 RepID=A0A4Y9ZW28_9AGAM|nr:hypothetical protein EWM64_g5742 [Hericium alpestre]